MAYVMTKEDATMMIERIRTSQSSSYWLKGALDVALKRDPVDAWKDADLLARILKARLEH